MKKPREFYVLLRGGFHVTDAINCVKGQTMSAVEFCLKAERGDKIIHVREVKPRKRKKERP